MKPLAIVTGATGGIGSAITRRLAGNHIVVGMCREAKVETAERWRSIAGSDAELLQADLTDHEITTSAIESMLERRGAPSLLVNCAGVTADSFFSKMSFSDWDRVLRTNLGSLFSVTQPVYRAMCGESGGAILNISSVNGERGQAGQVNYCASKAGVHGFTMALAREGARYGVRVNTVSPGYTATAMVKAIREDVLDQIVDSIPLGRLAEADEIAALVAFLASKDAAYITGANFGVNGGLHIR
jgi:acetoacetyl-CoA reductase